ncbi:MAG: tyrosine-type recombinase/integrase [Nitrospirota bacterium]
MKKPLNGQLGVLINRYLQVRRSLGYIHQNAQYTLNEFDRYLSQHFPNAKMITRPMIIGFLSSDDHLQASSVYIRFICLRQFCRFLFQLNPDTYVPETRLIPPGPTVRRPHIYTTAEAMKLIKLASMLTPEGSLRPHTYSTLISLLWVSGLRIGEALRLNLEDVDTDNAVLHIRQSKFLKSRLVHLTLSAASALETCRRRRAEHGHDQRPSAPFFINEYARRCSYSMVSITFRVLARQAGIKTVQGRTPRLHDFRHTFATRCLNDIYQTGKDPSASLPLLATYLGHVSIACTQVYLHPSAGLLATAGQRFLNISSNQIVFRKEAYREGI